MSGYTVKVRGGGGLRLFDYECADHGRFEALVELAASAEQPCPECGAAAEKAVSMPAVHTKFAVSVSTGKVAPPPHRLAMDLRNMGEGQSYAEWKSERRKLWAEEREKQVKELLK